MSFTTQLKDEITKLVIDPSLVRCELSSIIRYNGKISENIVLTFENASIARRVYKNIKEIYKINPKVIVRVQKRFRVKQIYIIEINEKVSHILEDLNIIVDGKKVMPEEYFLDTEESIITFLQGTFLSCGSISNPATSGYHLEFVFALKKDANFIIKLLKSLGFNAKVTVRNNKNMVYIKSAEEISDIIKMFKATNSLFYFEDIRIYRDHKNMVNRLNNCEIANQEKTFKTGMKQLSDIEYLKEHDLMMLLDEHTSLVVKYREKYPETSYAELAEIISLETDYKIGKSGINHHFIKVKKLVETHKNK